MSNDLKIVIRMPNWLGDAVMALPAIEQIREHYRAARITAMCLTSIEPLLKDVKAIDSIMPFVKPSGWLHRRQHSDIIAPLAAEAFDLGVLFTNSLSSSWWFWRAGVKKRIGFGGQGRSLLLTDVVALPKDAQQMHQVQLYKELLRPLNICPSNSKPHLEVSEEELATAREELIQCGWDGSSGLIGINPAAAFGPAKCWLPERFEQLTMKLIDETRFTMVYFGDASSKTRVDQICSRFSDRVVNLAGKTTLRQMICTIAICDLFLSNDSGPMHIAAAENVALVALFGSTSDIRTSPCGQGKIKIIHKHVECSPCYKRVCPIDFRCMKRIEVEEVYAALLQLWHEKNG